MTPADVVRAWVAAFNNGDAEAMADFYTEAAVNHQVAENPVEGRAAIREMFAAAVNHQVAENPVEGRAAIREMFAREFAQAEMVCLIENIFQDGDWAILEWRDPLGLRGCGFFRMENGKIAFQRGYWDKLSFLRLHNMPIPPD